MHAHSFLFTLRPEQPPTALLLVSGPRRLLALTGAVASHTTAAAASQLLAGSKIALRLTTEGAAVRHSGRAIDHRSHTDCNWTGQRPRFDIFHALLTL